MKMLTVLKLNGPIMVVVYIMKYVPFYTCHSKPFIYIQSV